MKIPRYSIKILTKPAETTTLHKEHGRAYSQFWNKLDHLQLPKSFRPLL
jgi:hypothetical protein